MDEHRGIARTFSMRHYFGGDGFGIIYTTVSMLGLEGQIAASYEHTLLLTIIMSNERPSDHARIRKMAGSSKGRLSSHRHLSRATTPSSIDMDSSFGSSTK